MLNLNDDMDDLIRQSAEEYPLKIEGKDWDKVLGAMQSATVINQPGKRKKYWWLLLLLLPLMVAIPYLFKNNNTQKTATYSNTEKAGGAVEKQNSGESVNKNDKSLSDDHKTTEQTGSNRIADQPLNENAGEEKQQEQQTKKQFNTRRTATIKNGSLISENDFKNGKENPERTGNDRSNNSTVSDRNLAVADSNVNSVNNKAQAANNGLAISEPGNKIIGGKETTLASTDSSNGNKDAITLKKDSATTATSSSKKDIKHTTPVKAKGLYAGIAAGLDVSTVKFHEINKVGHTVNLIVGYRINNTWSIESGLMWDNKHYYSPGEYFDKSRTDIPAGSYIHFLNGTCKMFEVPVNVKYDFSSKKRSSFYVSAGLSSYIMKKENYDYHATNSGVYYVGHRDYKNSTTNLFSVANINGGYQFIFKNNNSLRIEPYIKIPLSGLGIGKLPFGSAGISAAYTIPLH